MKKLLTGRIWNGIAQRAALHATVKPSRRFQKLDENSICPNALTALPGSHWTCTLQA